MQYYSKVSEHRLKRITIRISIFEIELRARPQSPREQVSIEERAYRRAQIEECMGKIRRNPELKLAMRT